LDLYQPYHMDACLTEIEAIVVGVEHERGTLDRTVFYARSGVRPTDRGALSLGRRRGAGGERAARGRRSRRPHLAPGGGAGLPARRVRREVIAAFRPTPCHAGTGMLRRKG
jgi:hypothetical protein